MPSRPLFDKEEKEKTAPLWGGGERLTTLAFSMMATRLRAETPEAISAAKLSSSKEVDQDVDGVGEREEWSEDETDETK